MITTQQHQALRMIGDAIVDSVREADRGLGVPAGPMYAALMAHGCTLEQFESIMEGLVRVNRLRRQGHLYFAV